MYILCLLSDFDERPSNVKFRKSSFFFLCFSFVMELFILLCYDALIWIRTHTYYTHLFILAICNLLKWKWPNFMIYKEDMRFLYSLETDDAAVFFFLLVVVEQHLIWQWLVGNFHLPAIAQWNPSQFDAFFAYYSVYWRAKWTRWFMSIHPNTINIWIWICIVFSRIINLFLDFVKNLISRLWNDALPAILLSRIASTSGIIHLDHCQLHQ